MGREGAHARLEGASGGVHARDLAPNGGRLMSFRLLAKKSGYQVHPRISVVLYG